MYTRYSWGTCWMILFQRSLCDWVKMYLALVCLVTLKLSSEDSLEAFFFSAWRRDYCRSCLSWTDLRLSILLLDGESSLISSRSNAFTSIWRMSSVALAKFSKLKVIRFWTFLSRLCMFFSGLVIEKIEELASDSAPVICSPIYVAAWTAVTPPISILGALKKLWSVSWRKLYKFFCISIMTGALSLCLTSSASLFLLMNYLIVLQRTRSVLTSSTLSMNIFDRLVFLLPPSLVSDGFPWTELLAEF